MCVRGVGAGIRGVCVSVCECVCVCLCVCVCVCVCVVVMVVMVVMMVMMMVVVMVVMAGWGQRERDGGIKRRGRGGRARESRAAGWNEARSMLGEGEGALTLVETPF